MKSFNTTRRWATLIAMAALAPQCTSLKHNNFDSLKDGGPDAANESGAGGADAAEGDGALSNDADAAVDTDGNEPDGAGLADVSGDVIEGSDGEIDATDAPAEI